MSKKDARIDKMVVVVNPCEDTYIGCIGVITGFNENNNNLAYVRITGSRYKGHKIAFFMEELQIIDESEIKKRLEEELNKRKEAFAKLTTSIMIKGFAKEFIISNSKKDKFTDEIFDAIDKVLSENNDEKENKEKKEIKHHNKELKKYKKTLPLIPCAGVESEPFTKPKVYQEHTTKYYSNDINFPKPRKNYFTYEENYPIYHFITGNFHRTKEEAIKNRKADLDSMKKAAEKQKDWVEIVRKAVKENNKDIGENDEVKKLIPDFNNIKLSKFYDKKDNSFTYYKISKIFSSGNKYFHIEKISRISATKYNILNLIAEDYAKGNFFLTEKEAKNSMMYKKMKTFFKDFEELSRNYKYSIEDIRNIMKENMKEEK